MRKRRIYVPGSERRAAGGLILPGSASSVPVLVGICRVPGCDREGTPFYKGQEEEWQRHVGWCARRHSDEIAADVADHRERFKIFSPESWDPEWTAHQRKVGERMKREGRLVPKPHER